jgi:hypothetical protein
MPNDAELTLGQKAARRRKGRIVVGLFVLLSGVPPLINAMDNPRIATLHVILKVGSMNQLEGFAVSLAPLMRESACICALLCRLQVGPR